MTQQVAPALWFKELAQYSWHFTLNFQEGEKECQGSTLLGGAGTQPPKTSLGRAKGIENQLQWPGGECHPSAHWAEDVNSHLVTRSGRMQNSMGVPSTLRALHHEVDMLGAGGDLCRAEGPGSSSPKGCGHPVTRMNVTSRVCVCVCGGAGY